MKTFATIAAAALITAGSLAPAPAEARGRGGAVAAGLIGGLAAGALLGAAISDAHAGPAYGYARPVAYGSGYGYGRPVGYGDAYDDEGPAYVPVRRPRPVRYYEDAPYGGGWDRPRPWGGRRPHCDRPYGGYEGGW